MTALKKVLYQINAAIYSYCSTNAPNYLVQF